MKFFPMFLLMKRNWRALLVLLIGLQLQNSVYAGTPPDEFPVNLLFSKKDIPRIFQNTQLPVFKEYWKSLLEADYEKDKNFLREAFLYAVTGDEQRGELARKGMLETLKLKRWDFFLENGKHTVGFLQAGRLTAWMSLSYDWIYELLSPEERAEVLHQIAEKGMVPCYRALYGMRYPETVKGWSFAPDKPWNIDVPDMSRWPVILGHNNFRAVVAGGMALGMYTLNGKDDRIDDWREMLLDSYYRFVDLIEPDGSYDEGVSYLNYAMTYLIYFVEVVDRQEGLDLFDAVNYQGMMDYNLAMLMPYHLDPAGSVNFGDAGYSLNSAVGFWIARKSRDGLSQYVAQNYAPRHNLLSFVHYDSTIAPTAPSPNDYFKHLSLDWIVTRTGYEMEDLVVAMRSGGPMNHEHGDRNSVILKYNGEILLADQYRPTYNRLLPDWLLRTSVAHNTILIDGEGHQYHHGEEGTNESKASAMIVRSGERAGYSYWASDATPAYALVNKDVKSVTRTVLVFPDLPALIVLDKVMKSEQLSSFSARWFAENRDKKAEFIGKENTFIITRPHAKFYAVCAGSPKVKVSTGKLSLPDSVGVFKYVDVGTKEKANDAFLVMAGVPMTLDATQPEISIKNTGESWLIEIVKDKKNLKLEILDDGKVPEFEVLAYQYE